MSRFYREIFIKSYTRSQTTFIDDNFNQLYDVVYERNTAIYKLPLSKDIWIKNNY